MKKKILFPAVLSILTIFSLTSCGPKSITKTEAQNMYDKTIETQRSKDYVSPKTFIIEETIDEVDLEDGEYHYKISINYDKENKFLYLHNEGNHDNKKIYFTSYLYVKDNYLYTYFDSNGTITSNKIVIDITNSFENTLDGNETLKEGIEILDASFLESLKTNTLNLLFLNEDTKYSSNGDGSLIIDFDSKITMNNLETTLLFKLEIENYRLTNYKNHSNNNNGNYFKIDVRFQYDKKVISYLDDNLFTK